jgi:hypothetical protein
MEWRMMGVVLENTGAETMETEKKNPLRKVVDAMKNV